MGDFWDSIVNVNEINNQLKKKKKNKKLKEKERERENVTGIKRFLKS